MKVRLIIGALALIGVTGIVAQCTITHNRNDNDAVVEMVAKGADPMRAACSVGRSMNGGSSGSPGCAILAAKETK